MKPTRGLLLAGALVVCFSGSMPQVRAGVGVDIFVDDNCSPPGDGSAGDPYCGIQEAVDQAAPGDRIVVRPGTYNECVNAALTSLIIQSDDTGQPTPNPSLYVIDGTGICDAETADSTVILGDGSVLQGFTIRGAGRSGVSGFGSVQITRNVIQDNAADFGGGIYLYTGVYYYGSVNISVTGNTIRGNDATEAGGGIFIDASALPARRADVVIQGNIIENNTGTGTGGGVAIFTNSADGATSTAVITQNTIQGNVVDVSPSYGGSYGGGLWTATYGYGSETIEVSENNLLANTSADDGGGASVWLQAATTAQHVVEVTDNDVRGNTAAGDGGGLDLYAQGDILSTGTLSYLVQGNVVADNVAGAFGGGMLVTLQSFASELDPLAMRVIGNEIRGNTAGTSGGGVALAVGADGQPDPGTLEPSFTSLLFRNNLVVQNEATNVDDTGSGGGVAVVLQAISDAVARAELDFNTIADNLSDIGAGGIDVVSLTTFDTFGSFEGQTELEVSNSILLNNTGFALGGPTLGSTSAEDTGNLSITLAYSDLFGNGGTIEGTLLPVTTQSNVLLTDPALGASYLPDRCSPTIDAADPAVNASNEAPPTGGRANLGHTGGTVDAIAGLPDLNGDGVVDGVDVLRIATSFAATPAQSHFNPAADLDGNGLVDGADLAYVAAAFGDSCP